MLFKGIGRTFSTENNCQFETIDAFWDELCGEVWPGKPAGTRLWQDRTVH